MKFMKYTFFIFLIVVITMTLMAYVSPSFRGDVVELLASVKDQLTNYFQNDRSHIAENPLGLNKKQKKIISQAAENISPESVSLEPSQNKVGKSDLGSKVKSFSQISPKVSFGSKENRSSNVLEDQGFIYVTSTPESASVTVEGTNAGKTPVTVRVSPSGIYTVQVQLKYFDIWEKRVQVYSSEVTKVHAKLNPGKGALTVISVPQEAEVHLDGVAKGKTPLTIKPIGASRHALKVVKGNREYTEDVEILTGENKILNIALKVLRANLSVDSKPTGAKVYIDGLAVGTTPAKIHNVKIGDHRIVLVKNHSLVYVDSIFVYPEKNNTYFTALENKSRFTNAFSAKMKIDSELNKANAYLDGSFRGTVPVEINNVRSGEHEILIVRTVSEGSYFYKSKFIIDSHESREIFLKAKDFKFKKR